MLKFPVVKFVGQHLLYTSEDLCIIFFNNFTIKKLCINLEMNVWTYIKINHLIIINYNKYFLWSQGYLQR